MRSCPSELKAALLFGLCAVVATPCHSESSFVEALTGGRLHLLFRYRYEQARDAAPNLKDAYASTLRSALGYQTGSFYDFSAFLELEDVRVIGSERYNDGGSNGIRDRATVVDPEGTELQQGYLRYSGIGKSVLTLGRQEITHREAPFHRYVGNVLFRQNWQSYDALRFNTLALPNTVLDYSYVWNVNRIFGEDHPSAAVSDFRMRGHLLNAQYSGLGFGKLETYAYLLDFKASENEPLSSATLGARLQGSQVLSPKWRGSYAVELAKQTDYASNPASLDANYGLLEGGLSYAIGKPALENFAVKLSYEHLGSDGGKAAFQTPLGTNHAFQGFADRFVVTPNDGIRDVFVTLSTRSFGAPIAIIYHRYHSDHDGYDYGTEWNLVAEKTIAERFLVGIKFADYDADDNALNQARNVAARQAFDLRRSWVYFQYKY